MLKKHAYKWAKCVKFLSSRTAFRIEALHSDWDTCKANTIKVKISSDFGMGTHEAKEAADPMLDDATAYLKTIMKV